MLSAGRNLSDPWPVRLLCCFYFTITHIYIAFSDEESLCSRLNQIIVSPLHTNLQVVNFWTICVWMSDQVKLVHVSGINCHMSASSTNGWTFVCFTIQHCVEDSSTVSLFLLLYYFGYLTWRADSFEKTLMLGKIEGRRRRGWWRMRWLDGITS